MKLLIVIFSFVSIFAAWAVQPNEACFLPVSKLAVSMSFIVPFEPPALPPPVTKASQAIATTSSVINAVSAVGVTQLSQTSRTFLTLGIVSCNDAGRPDQGSLSWQDSPSQISIGDDDLEYHYGAVVGNWIVFGGISAILSLTAMRIGFEKVHYPGVLILPAMIFLSPTITSAVSLLRDGDSIQQAVAALSVGACTLGAGLFGLRFLPQFFHASWSEDQGKWVDASDGFRGFVARNGLLFEDYRPGYQWFMLVEVLMSTSVGALKSYQALQENCGLLLDTAASVYSTYGLLIILLHPAKHRYEQIFYATVAGSQALALVIQTVASKAGSSDTQQSVRVVTESIITATDYLLMIKSLYDFSKRMKSIYTHFFRTISVRSVDPIPGLFQPSVDDRALELLPVNPNTEAVFPKSDLDLELLDMVLQYPTEMNPLASISLEQASSTSRSSTPLTRPSSPTTPISAVGAPLQHNILLEMYQFLDRKEDS
ncbi:MAG: hypothetical protein I8H75_04395 [Myxococcaceae bacterium]|nr:hypothetical protein [Myxococcaceae bacterium]MBH2006563.1 hypothetical protein [Myxococcaceae bacterium]